MTVVEPLEGSVVTDGAGQYRIVDLRPGVYAVTFTLTGFSIRCRTKKAVARSLIGGEKV